MINSHISGMNILRSYLLGQEILSEKQTQLTDQQITTK
jgi:hypothetical protein